MILKGRGRCLRSAGEPFTLLKVIELKSEVGDLVGDIELHALQKAAYVRAGFSGLNVRFGSDGDGMHLDTCRQLSSVLVERIEYHRGDAAYLIDANASHMGGLLVASIDIQT